MSEKNALRWFGQIKRMKNERFVKKLYVNEGSGKVVHV